MQDAVSAITGVFDQLNPFNAGNLILYFGWLVVFAFTTVAIWRSPRSWVRLVCFLVNQVCSVGVLLSWTLTGLLAYTYWRASLATLVAVGALALYAFRRKRQPAE